MLNQVSQNNLKPNSAHSEKGVHFTFNIKIKTDRLAVGLFCYSLPVTIHLTRQAVSVSTRKNESRRSPAKTAPRTLVAGNSIARSTTAKSMVAIIAPRSTEIILLIQQGDLFSQQLTDATVTRRMARYTTAMPKTTHKNAGVIVIAAVILRKAVMIPTAMLTIRAIVVQLFLQVQSLVDIFSPPDTLYVSFSARCKREAE